MIPRAVLYIAVAAFILRAFLLTGILASSGIDGVFLPDSRGFYQTAINITEGHGFSRNTAEPFLPSAYFPPLYPLAIAASITLSGSVLPLILLQIILSSLVPILIWRIGRLLTERRAPPLIAAVLAGFEPISMFWSVVLLTDVLAFFFLIAATLFFCRFLVGRSLRHAGFAGILLGLAALVRPDGQFLFSAALLYFAIALMARFTKKPEASTRFGAARSTLAAGSIFAVAFYLTVSPWLIRNWVEFKTTSVATTGLRNVYVSLAPAVMSLKTGRTYDEETETLVRQFSEKYRVRRKDMYENPAYGNALVKEGLRVLLQNPKETAELFLIDLNAFFTQDLYTTYLRHYGVIPRFSFDFSPSVVLLREGPIELATKVWQRLGMYAVIPILGRLLWVGITLFGLFGAYTALKNKKERAVAAVLLIVIAYYASSSMAAGFSDYGRHRYPANAFIFLFAGYGIVSLKLRPGKKREPAELMSPQATL